MKNADRQTTHTLDLSCWGAVEAQYVAPCGQDLSTIYPLCSTVWSSEIHLLPWRECHWFGKIFFEDIELFYTGLIRKSGSRMPQARERIEVSVGQFSFEVLHTQWSGGLQWLCRQDANCCPLFTPQGHFMCWSLQTDGKLFQYCCVCDRVSASVLWAKNLVSVSVGSFSNKNFWIFSIFFVFNMLHKSPLAGY